MVRLSKSSGRARSAVAFVIGVGSAWMLLPAGCFDYLSDCARIGTCAPAGGGGGGGGGNVTPACVPSTNASAVDGSCGIFASSSVGDDTNAGTKAAPVKTIAKAIELAKAANTPVYTCAETFEEAVSAPAGSVIYGGLSCASGWVYVGDTKKTSIAPLADPAAASSIALTLSGGAAKTHVEDLAVTAPDAKQAGGSSIAVLADGGDVELVRCDLVAGNGMKGAKGATPSDPIGPSDPNDPAIRGVDGLIACSGNPLAGNPGGNGTTNALCMTSVGGIGGTGHDVMGEAGTDGQPLPSPNPNNKGLGGAGDPGDGSGCNAGSGGKLGVTGTNGAGAPMTSEGALSSAGFIGASGGPGVEGGPGQGGGGGGAAKGKLNCNGASGGGGGAGGCGGKGGLGGQGGGASIAFASVNATVLLKNVTFLSGTGGDGGDGGDGQAGGTGGVGGVGGAGVGTLNACDGGKGGQGGFGGRGGGGRGGPSAGIAYTGTPPVTDGGSAPTLGQPGNGGLGADPSKDGAPGTKAEILDLSKGI